MGGRQLDPFFPHVYMNELIRALGGYMWFVITVLDQSDVFEHIVKQKLLYPYFFS